MGWLYMLTLGLVAITSVVSSPSRLGYLFLDSYEVDSSEHGGEAGAKSTTCPCGWANKISSRIVNGTETARNEFPFAAGVAHRGTRRRFCGATIITQYHALTAAHCTEHRTADKISLIVGIHNVNTDFDPPADDIPVERIVDHAGYDTDKIINDISLLVLEREIKFSRLVGPACLPRAGPPRLDIDRQYIKIVGWGAEKFRGSQSQVLRKVDVRVVPMIECNRVYKSVSMTNPTQICTYANEKASCQGDSGGPVIWVDPETNRYTHVGIVSFGQICANFAPTVHTSVQDYLDWIIKNVRATKPDAKTCTKLN